MAEWLNVAFNGFDTAIFNVMNGINCGFLNTFCKYFSYLGEKGLGFIFASLILMCFAKTRKSGFCMLLAIAFGALMTNVVIKNVVERARPYVTNGQFNAYWQQAGANLESEFSFPSGHTTASTAFGVAMFLSFNKKWSWAGILGAFLMGFCRIYLVVHYPTDVIAGLLVGTIGALASYFVTKLLYTKWIDKNPTNKFCSFVREFSVVNIFTKDKKKSD